MLPIKFNANSRFRVVLLAIVLLAVPLYGGCSESAPKDTTTLQKEAEAQDALVRDGESTL